jgi:multidrug efflux system outer membrane protein
VLLAVQADVAQTYFRCVPPDAELETLNRTVQTRRKRQVNQRRFDLGDIGEFDLSRAKTELATARAEAIGLQRQRATTEHALAVLLGKPAASYTAAAHRWTTALLPVIPAGLPSTLLERRPDIAPAQRAMEAANARIGVARSAMFPALVLNANAAAPRPTPWRTCSSGAAVRGCWAPDVDALIDGGRNKAAIRAAKRAGRIGGTYRQSVLTAFAEVEDNLAGLRIWRARRADRRCRGVGAPLGRPGAEAVCGGRSSYLDLLDAQRNLAIERNAVQLRGNRAVTTVALIRALGGGWGETEPQVAAN